MSDELAWWMSQPLDPWQPVGDQRQLAARFGHDPDQPRELKLTAPPKLSPADYAGGVQACLRAFRVAYENREHITYTEGPLRWDGIANRRRSINGDYPHDCDCSAFATWGGWDGLLFMLRNLGDIFNGDQFQGGYTGTLVQHGEAVELGHTVPLDFVFYGGTIWVPQHVAITVGGERVISMGHPGDPGIYPINLYGQLPIVAIRRMIIRA